VSVLPFANTDHGTTKR